MKKHRRIFGIDFSGAQDAGKKIWITTGLSVGDGQKFFAYGEAFRPKAALSYRSC
ncbi:MAG: hypothetical protein P8X90_21870 [Desulfobacterales bacterium]|jgi:hypothetical protein